ncbi:MAG TPA: WD40 repeat domain-containing protein [Candidatus Saccharimonadales bacterium]|jgi:hypothetical protein|nr:WD40 repeat domain-containing protein [Candidatus Saccharimonadales bacterium]
MKRLFLLLCAGLLAVLPAFAQPKKAGPAGGAATAAAKICAEPYQVREAADGVPEGPVVILFHREKSKAPWARNLAIRMPGVEAATPASAHTVVCVEESRIEAGRYDSGEPAYSPAWDITLVRIADRRVFFGRTGFYGAAPPGVKYHRGAGVGKPPVEMFTRWLRLLIDQKVARFKMKFPAKEYHEASSLSFSADGSRLALAQEPRSSSSGTPPTPITVFDLASGKTVTTLHTDYIVRAVTLSRTGKLLATERYGHPEIWDVATGAMIAKLDASGVESLAFGPGSAPGDEVLATANKESTTLWDAGSRQALRSAPGTHATLSKEGKWLVARKEGKRINVQELESGRILANFPDVSAPDKYVISRDGLSLARYSSLGGSMFTVSVPDRIDLGLPALGVGILYAVAPTNDGFALGNGDGIAGLISSSNTEARAFATDHTAIHALAVSLDGKLLAVGDSSGNVSVWELL